MSASRRPAIQLHHGVETLLPPLVSSPDGSPPALKTTASLCWRRDRLEIGFEAEDPDPWGEFRLRDSPVWEQGAVEVFLAPGVAPPTRYFEIQVSPLGTVFDAAIHNPHGDRTEMVVDPSWDCAGLETEVEIDRERQLWRARFSIPLASVTLDEWPPPASWSLNLYRVAHPRPGQAGPAVFSAWSPTWISPPDFHRPARFGILELLY